MHFDRYLKLLSFAIAGVFLFVAAFNRLIDSYALYEGPVIEGLNKNKPVFSRHLRLSKAAAIRKYKPTAIVLGTSRAEYAIDPKHAGWQEDEVYNLGLSSANLYEAFRYMQHAQAVHSLNQVVLMADFRMFNANENNENDFEELQLAVDVNGDLQSDYLDIKIPTLLSLDALIQSVETIYKQNNTDSIYLENGMLDTTHNDRFIYDRGGHRNAFIQNEKGYFKSYKNFSFVSTTNNRWKTYKELLLLAQQNNIQLNIVIPPTHARQSETIVARGIWNDFEKWKRKLVELNEQVALEQNRELFPIWDFSGYNSYTTESVTENGDKESTMQWYWESSHYKKELGDLVLDRIFNYKHPDRVVNDDFGVLLNSDTIEPHLRQIRNDQLLWRQSYTEDVAEIEALKEYEN
jgi:hypothetical protein